MVKKVSALFLLVFICSLGYAQEGTSSPYSFLGIGDLKFRGTAENIGMGRIRMFSDSIHLNLQNPAAYSKLKYTTYTIGMDHSRLGLKSDAGNDNVNSSSLNYLAIGIPLGKKMGFGFGVMPFTSVGYNLQSEDTSVSPNEFFQYEGEGGLNKVFLSFGLELFKDLELGATLNYNFGNIKNQNTKFIEDVQYGTRSRDESELSGLDLNIGLNYTTKLNDKLSLRSSFVFAPEANINSDNTRELLILTLSGVGSELVSVREEIDLGDQAKTELTLPSKSTFGLGLGENNKWFAGAEVSLQNTSDFGNGLTTIDGVSYNNAAKFALGGFYVPKHNSFTSYWDRVTYRAGIRYEDTGISIRDEAINDFGISFGVGLPVGRSLSNVNLGVEVGKRGTTNSGLIQENYVNFNLSVSFNNKWFKKRKYN